MAAMSMVASSRVVPPPLPVARFTLDQYHRMIRNGILDEDDAVELLDGWIISKMPRNPPDDFVVTRLQRLLADRLGDQWVLRQQCAITIDESEPEPDFCVALGPDTRYADHHPGAQEIVLLIEVSNTTLDQDRDLKGPVYAGANAPLYWIANVVDRQVEVYSDPTGPDPKPAYRARRDYRIDESVPIVLNGNILGSISVREIMPL